MTSAPCPDMCIAIADDPLQPYLEDFVTSSLSIMNNFQLDEAAHAKFTLNL
jgi:hypothetical protein